MKHDVNATKVVTINIGVKVIAQSTAATQNSAIELNLTQFPVIDKHQHTIFTFCLQFSRFQNRYTRHRY